MTRPDRFSPRELDVIELLLRGKSNKQIALALGLANRTVEFHLSNIYARLGVASRTEAVLKLSETGLRESAAASARGGVRKSAVAKDSRGSDNTGKSFLLRRIPMKNLLYILGTLILTIALIVAVTLLATSGGGTPSSVQSTSTGALPAGPDPSGPTATPAALPTLTPEDASSPVLSTVDVAEFVGENYPDWTNVPAGTSFTKTWTFRNAGTIPWTTGYRLKLTGTSHPLGLSVEVADEVRLPHQVEPGGTVEISVPLQVPDVDGIYSFHWRLENGAGQIVSGAGSDIWVTFTVGEVAFDPAYPRGSISVELVGIDRGASYTSAHLCAQYPDTQDWNPTGVSLAAGGVRASIESYSLENAKDPSTHTSSYRCFALGFPTGTDQYADAPVSITIDSFRVPAETNLEANCARAKQQLASSQPGLEFTCGPAGFFYSNLMLPAGLSSSQADKIIMDALEQVIYGPWTLAE